MSRARQRALFPGDRSVPQPAEVASSFATAHVNWTSVIIIGTITIAQFAGSAAGAATMIALAAWSLRRATGPLQALTIGILIVFINPGIAPNQPGVSALKWVLLMTACGGLLLRGAFTGPVLRPIIAIAAYCIVVFVTSVFVSADLALSCFKLVTFFIGASTAFAAFRFRQNGAQSPGSWLMTVHCAVVLMSLPLMVSPIGYLRNETGFQGILNQPQALAVYVAPMIPVLIYRAITKPRDLTMVALACASTACLLMTRSRTGLLIVLISASLTSMSVFVWRAQARRTVVLGWVASGIALVLVIGASVILGLGGKLVSSVEDYVVKGTSSGSVDSLSGLKDAAGSRESQWETNVENWKSDPFFGVGFGMASSQGVAEVERDPVFDLPLSAPTEAGFLPLAVLGQTGIIGLAALCILIIMLFGPILSRGAVEMQLLCLGAVAANVGEMIFFASGGLGLEMWLLIAFCYNSAVRSGSAK